MFHSTFTHEDRDVRYTHNKKHISIQGRNMGQTRLPANCSIITDVTFINLVATFAFFRLQARSWCTVKTSLHSSLGENVPYDPLYMHKSGGTNRGEC